MTALVAGTAPGDTEVPQPIPVLVRRYKCPHCSRSRAKKSATIAHIARCWDNPANRACRTCANYEPPESGGCYGDPQCNCPDDIPQGCAAGVVLPDFGGDMVTGCPEWKAVGHD